MGIDAGKSWKVSIFMDNILVTIYENFFLCFQFFGRKCKIRKKNVAKDHFKSCRVHVIILAGCALQVTERLIPVWFFFFSLIVADHDFYKMWSLKAL